MQAATPTTGASEPRIRLPLYRKLYVQVLAAICLGALLGHLYPDIGSALKPLGDGFIKLVKMIIAPVIFVTVATGIDYAVRARRLRHVASGEITGDGAVR